MYEVVVFVVVDEELDKPLDVVPEVLLDKAVVVVLEDANDDELVVEVNPGSPTADEVIDEEVLDPLEEELIDEVPLVVELELEVIGEVKLVGPVYVKVVVVVEVV